MFPSSSTATYYSGIRTSGHKFKVLLFTMFNTFTANSLTNVNKVIIMRHSLIIENTVIFLLCVLVVTTNTQRLSTGDRGRRGDVKTMTDDVGS